MKDKIKEILEAYGCLNTHNPEYWGEVLNEIRNEELIDDLYTLFINELENEK